MGVSLLALAKSIYYYSSSLTWVSIASLGEAPARLQATLHQSYMMYLPLYPYLSADSLIAPAGISPRRWNPQEAL